MDSLAQIDRRRPLKPTNTVKPTHTVTLVIPVHNEAAGLRDLVARLDDITCSLHFAFTFLFIDDGSTDSSFEILDGLRADDPRIGILSLSRRFGKEAAVSAGLAHADGDGVVVMDADLQDPPDCLPAMLNAWQDGHEVVVMRRRDRRVDSWFKRFCAAAFYASIRRLSAVEIPEGVGDFRLMSRRVVAVVNELPEANRCLKELFAWIGFRTKTLDYERKARANGSSQWSLTKLVGLAVDGLTASSIAPLRLATLAGSAISVTALLFGLVKLSQTVLHGVPVPERLAEVLFLSLLGGAQLLAIGLLGEYVGRSFVESKRRPVFIVDSLAPARTTSRRAALASSRERR